MTNQVVRVELPTVGSTHSHAWTDSELVNQGKVRLTEHTGIEPALIESTFRVKATRGPSLNVGSKVRPISSLQDSDQSFKVLT